ncbi:hypothetical protein [Streptomyces sp. NRRL S-1824]|uniref:hypothetical protein n=1 Tax=Streptomyces sp. NRRL S-1824 TaxID=1463889 RepID=UPI000ACA90FC|nr:hypothetical protein [Streptomyces sp. NRRL S-1824]
MRARGITEIAPEALMLHLNAFHHGITAGLSQHPRAAGRKQSTARNLLERLRDQAHADLRHVSFTSSCGERALRPVKPQLKIPGCHQSAFGATTWPPCVPTRTPPANTG